MMKNLGAASVVVLALSAAAPANAAGSCVGETCTGFNSVLEFAGWLNTAIDGWLGTTQVFNFNQALAIPGFGFVATVSTEAFAGIQTTEYNIAGLKTTTNPFQAFASQIEGTDVRAVPGPIAGAGLPVIAGMLAYGFYRRRQQAA